MNDQFLLDTDVLIDLLEGLAPVLEFLEQLRPRRYAINLVTYGELYEGILGSSHPERARARFESFLVDADIDIVPLTVEVARAFGGLRYQLRKSGNVIGTSDLLIAATAVAFGFPLVTRNHRHFNRVPGLKLLTPSDLTGTGTPLDTE